MINEKTVSDAIEYRRSVRVFSDQDLDSEIVKNAYIMLPWLQTVVIYNYGNLFM